MQHFSKTSFASSEKHKDLTEARTKRDQSDLQKIRQKLEMHNPFTTDSSLRNIITGVEANNEVNVHNYVDVGKQIIQNMKGQLVFSFSCKRKDKATQQR